MLIYILTFGFMYVCGLVIFIFSRKHLLLILLSLEYMVVSLYIILFLFLRISCFEYFFSLIYLTIRVCERALGLSVLVLIIRVHGNDYISIFRFLW